MRKGEVNPMASCRLIRADFEDEPYLTYAEAAEIAGVTVGTILNWVKCHNISRVRSRGPYKIDREQLYEFIETGIPQD